MAPKTGVGLAVLYFGVDLMAVFDAFLFGSVQIKKCKTLKVFDLSNFALLFLGFAVRAGFEPAVQFNPYGSLANY
jgi:hypothetical protein